MENLKRRKPIVALLLSLISPGLGQIYNGQLMRGVIIYLIVIVLGLALFFSGLFFKFYGMIFCIVIVLSFFFFYLLDAFIGAIKLKEISLKPYNRWYLYTTIGLISIFIIQPSFSYAIKNHIVRGYKIPSRAMEPTLLVDDNLIADMKIYKKEKPNRGDIVIFKYPNDRSKDYIKRVIGLGGDKIEIKNKNIFINDQPYKDAFGIYSDDTIYPAIMQPRDNFGPVTVPRGSLFVMGDNRDESADSRFWGFVDLKDVEGKALYIYWAKDKGRIGKEIR